MAKAKKKFHAVVILDRSGSMGSVRKSTIDGVNEYTQTLNRDDGDMKVTLATFSSSFEKMQIEYLYDNIAIKDVKPLTEEQYSPGGMTPLLDAVGSVIKKIEAEYKDKKNNPDISFMIINEGEENSSVEYKNDTIKTLIQEKQKEGWGFAYLGANQDAWSVASGLGIAKSAAKNYIVNNMVGTFVAAAYATTDARRAHRSTIKWDGEDPDLKTDK